MKLAVCIYKYFAFGGLARDFQRIMEVRRDVGDEIDVYHIEWHGERLPGFQLLPVSVSGITNHAKMRDFHKKVRPMLDAGNYDLVIGFNKMPGLDLYYAADPCYLARVREQLSYPIRRHFGRVKFYEESERAVFGVDSHTVSMMISEPQKKLFQEVYQTPGNRLIDLPPGIDPNRRRPHDWRERRDKLRYQFGVQQEDILLLMVGTGFKTKGVDRAIKAMSNLPELPDTQYKLFIIGADKSGPWFKLAQKLGVSDKVRFLGGRKDVPDFLLAGDLLIHPARKENTGTVILEAMVAGLPVLVSQVCGYAHHVLSSGAGELIDEPDEPQLLAAQIKAMTSSSNLERLSKQALLYAETVDLYSMPKHAADLIEKMAYQKRGAQH